MGDKHRNKRSVAIVRTWRETARQDYVRCFQGHAEFCALFPFIERNDSLGYLEKTEHPRR